MAKQKGFHEKVIQKMKRDAGFAWTGGFIKDMRALVDGAVAREVRAEHPIIFTPSSRIAIMQHAIK